jgi:hypothetical protein
VIGVSPKKPGEPGVEPERPQSVLLTAEPSKPVQPEELPRKEKAAEDKSISILERIASVLGDIQRDMSTVTGIAKRGGASASRMSEKDLAGSMISALSDAASRS